MAFVLVGARVVPAVVLAVARAPDAVAAPVMRGSELVDNAPLTGDRQLARDRAIRT